MTRLQWSVCVGLTCICVLALAGNAGAALEWTGAVDNDLFNEANWLDTTTNAPPPAGAVDPAVDVNNQLVISMGMPFVDAAGFSAPLQLGAGGAGTLNLSGGMLDMVGPAGANGIRAAEPVTGVEIDNSPVTISNSAAADLQFLLDIDMTLRDSGVATLQGGGNPLNLSTVDFQSLDALVHFTAETVEQATNEHINNGKFFVFGQPGALGVNLMVVDDGTGNGSFVTAVPEPAAAALIGWMILGALLLRPRL